MPLIYRSAWLYDCCIGLLYGRYAGERCAAVADAIAPESSVLELCCGTGHLYRRHLAKKRVRYQGVDHNPIFVGELQRRGIPVALADARDYPIGDRKFDYAVMQGALAEFRPDAGEIIKRMRRGVRRAVILSESIRHLVHSRHRWLARLAAEVSRPLLGSSRDTFLRFRPEELDQLLEPYRSATLGRRLICGGRTLLIRLGPLPPAAES